MRLILAFLLFAVFGFVQQDCHKDKATTTTIAANKTGTTAQADSNAVAVNSQTAATTAASAPTPEEAPRISLADAKKNYDAGTALFIDTRGADSYNVEHIKGAINIPAGEFETRYTEVAKAKKIIAYCS